MRRGWAQRLAFVVGCVALLAAVMMLCVGEELGIKLRTDMSRAASRSAADEVRLLLFLGVSPNGRTAGVHPALVAAVEVGDVELARLLLAAGADPNPSLKSGDAPLCLARRLAHPELMTLLSAHGATCAR